MNRILTTGILFLIAASTSATAAEKAMKIPPERLAHYWLLASSSASNAYAPLRGKNLDVPSCAAVSYIVESNGSTSAAKLEKLVPLGDLGKVAVKVVQRMQFAPTAQNPGKRRVATYVVMPFNLPAADSPKPEERALRAKTLAACALQGYGEKTTIQVIPVR